MAQSTESDRVTVAISRGTLAFIWIYQGLVPKLLGPDATELAMDMALGISQDAARQVAMIAGVTEILIGLSVLAFYRSRWPLLLTLMSMAGLLGYVLIATPQLVLGAFNPVTINIAMAALAVISLRAQKQA